MIRITKDTLRQLNATSGKLDKDTGQIIIGFVGRLEMSDRLYHGEIHYRDACDKPPAETVSIQSILSPGKPLPPATHHKTVASKKQSADAGDTNKTEK
jgi:hypothetical protein